MNKLWTAWYYVKAASPWLIASFVPSLIVGLSQYPRTKGLADILKKMLDGLSILSFKDSPGTVKAPLLPSARPLAIETRKPIPLPPAEDDTVVNSPPPMPPGSIILPLIAFLTLSGCAHHPGMMTGAVGLAGDAVCLAGDAAQVENSIRGGGSDWMAVVVELAHCVPSVIQHIQQMAMTADASGKVVAPVLSGGAKKRLKVAKVLGAVVNSNPKAKAEAATPE